MKYRLRIVQERRGKGGGRRGEKKEEGIGERGGGGKEGFKDKS